MNEVINHFLDMAGVNQMNVWMILAFLALILGSLQTSLTHALKQEKMMAHDDRDSVGDGTEWRFFFWSSHRPAASNQSQAYSSELSEHEQVKSVDTENDAVPSDTQSSNVITFPQRNSKKHDDQESSLPNRTRGSA